LTDALKRGAALVALAACSGHAVSACGPDATVAPIDDYTFTFRVCGNSLFGTVTAKATGWVAVGFSRSQYMPATDVFMAGVLADGTVYGKDAFAFSRSPPVIDASQDVQLLDASESNGVTTYAFSRLLTTGDSADFDLRDGPYYILGAFHLTSDSLTDRHTSADAYEFTFHFAPVAEPQSLLMLLAGLGLLASTRYRPR
jgi:hypothetical protein